MSVEIAAVDIGGLGVRRGLPAFLMIFFSLRPLNGIQGTWAM